MRALGQDTLFPSIPPGNTSACVNRGQLTRPRQLLARWSYSTGHIWPARTPALRWPRRSWRGNDVRMKFKTRITSTFRNLAAGKCSQTTLAVKHTLHPVKRGLLTQGDMVTFALFCCLCNFCLCGAKCNKTEATSGPDQLLSVHQATIN